MTLLRKVEIASQQHWPDRDKCAVCERKWPCPDSKGAQSMSTPLTAAVAQQGLRVDTPLGPGSLAYVRLAPPDYRTPEAASVLLDARRADALSGRYSGTVFPAADVTVRAD